MAFVPPARHLLRAKDLADARYAEPLGRRRHGAPRPACRAAHFSREFRRAFGESPHAYLLTRRLERAAALLRTTDRSVADICLVGRPAERRLVHDQLHPDLRHVARPPTAPPSRRPPSRRCVPGLRRARLRAPATPHVSRRQRPGARPSVGRDPLQPDEEDPMIRIANAQLWVHDQDEALAFYTREGRHGGARRRHAPRDGRLPLADRRRPPDRTDVSIVLMADPRPAGDGRRDRRRRCASLMAKGFAGHGLPDDRRLPRLLRGADAPAASSSSSRPRSARTASTRRSATRRATTSA